MPYVKVSYGPMPRGAEDTNVMVKDGDDHFEIFVNSNTQAKNIAIEEREKAIRRVCPRKATECIKQYQDTGDSYFLKKALELFNEMVGAGVTPPQEVLKFIAQGIGRYLEGQRFFPKKQGQHSKLSPPQVQTAAWCVALKRHYGLTYEEAVAAVAEELRVSDETIRRAYSKYPYSVNTFVEAIQKRKNDKEAFRKAFDKLWDEYGHPLGEDSEEATSVKLLQDIKQLFVNHKRIASKGLADRLGDMEDRPWQEWHQGKPITPRQVAKLLKPFGIKPKNVRIGDRVPKGYEIDQFDDVFARYLSDLSATPLQASSDAAHSHFRSATNHTDVADKSSHNSLNDIACRDVADKKQDTLSKEGVFPLSE